MTMLQGVNLVRKESKAQAGFRIITYTRLGAPIVLRWMADAGSLRDPLSSPGLMHFMEHGLMAGTSRLKNKQEMALALEKWGISPNAFTSSSSLAVTLSSGFPEALPDMIGLMLEVVFDAQFRSGAIENERSVILQEQRRKQNSLATFAQEEWRRLLYKGSGVEGSTLGTAEAVSAISVEQLRDAYQTHIPLVSNTLLVLGDIDHEKVVAEVNQQMAVWSDRVVKKDLVEPDILPFTQVARAEIAVEGAKGVELVLGWRIPAVAGRQYAASRLLSSIMVGGQASRLYRKLRGEMGAVYSVSMHRYQFSDSDLVMISTNASKEEIQKVEPAIAEVLRGSVGTITQAELDRSRMRIQGNLRGQYEEIEQVASIIGVDEMRGFGSSRIEEFYELLPTITLEEVHDLLSFYLEQPSATVLLGNI